MKTFKVVVVENPSVIEQQNGAEASVVFSKDDILAKDAQTAVFLAGRASPKEAKIRQSLLEITAVPFGQ